MPSKFEDYPNTTYTVAIRGDRDELVSGRTHRVMPDNNTLAEALVRFNHTKRDEYRRTEVVVLRTRTEIVMFKKPSDLELAAAKRRIENSRAARPVDIDFKAK